MELLYLLVALFSTTIGAVSGLGGGVIIKPVLDALGQYDVATIGMLSTFTVFSMALVSSLKQYAAGIKFEGKRSLFISLGSIAGGIGGNSLFSIINVGIEQGKYITAVQSFILALLLVLVLIYLFSNNIQNLHIHNAWLILSAGFCLGITAAFLGVGGGPFNVVLLSFLFSMDSKSAAVHSVIIILFSQSAKILTTLVTTGFGNYELFLLLYMIPGGVIGGLLGSTFNRKLKAGTIQFLFRLVVSLIIILNVYNFIKALFY